MLLLDGKTFAEDQIVIALGVTPTGEKRVLGLVQTATENKRACAAFLSAAQKPDTTNRIESVMAQIEPKTQRVDHWRTSDQQQRWVAATLLQIEATFRCVRGFKHLALLQTALTTKLTATAVAA